MDKIKDTWGVKLLYRMLCCCLLLASCTSGAQVPPSPQNAERSIAREADIAPHIVGIYTNPMYRSEPVVELILNTGDGAIPATLAYYLDVEADENGELMWDDSQLVSLLVCTEAGVYPLISRQRSNGSLLLDFYYTDAATGTTTLVVRTTSGTADVTFWEYRYDAARDVFIETLVYQAGGEITLNPQKRG